MHRWRASPSEAGTATAILIELAGVENLLVMQIPLRRAVRFKPGEALRYA